MATDGSVGASDQAIGLVTTATIPAELRFLEMLRVAVHVALDGSGCDRACDTDLVLATDELAAVLITMARTRSSLAFALTHDRAAVHIRMVVPRSPLRSEQHDAEFNRLLLSTTVDAYDLSVTDDDVTGTLRRHLSG